MRTGIRFLAVFVVAIAAFAQSPIATADTAPQPNDPVADWKAAHDTDPHTPLTAIDREWIATKQANADRWLASKAIKGAVSASPMAASRGLNVVQQSQQTSYWCGPAALSEILDWFGVSLSQSGSATLLKATTSGTAWSGVNINVPSPSGYPMRDALNYKLNTTWYVPIGLPGSPTASMKSAYRSALVSDIDQSYPLVGDAWETSGSAYHLNGHPSDREIFHWYAINGYENSGGGTDYVDSVAGATSVTWYTKVPRYSVGYPSDQITTINGGRGYVW